MDDELSSLEHAAEPVAPLSKSNAAPPDPIAEAETLPIATPSAVAAGRARVDPRESQRAGHERTSGIMAPLASVTAAVARWPHGAHPSLKRPRLSVLTLALLVAVVASTVLAGFAFTSGLPFSLLAAFSRSRAATPTSPGVDGTSGIRESPQGCVDGVAPPAAQGPYGPIYSTRGYPGIHNEVALTFDDGPNPVYTPQILAELEAAEVHATFFVVGRHAELYPELVRQEWQDGDTIGNHTFGHEWIPGLAPDQLRANLSNTSQVIRNATGDQCVWLFRAPFGDYLPPVRVAPPTSTPTSGRSRKSTPTPAPTPTTPLQVPVTVTRAWTVVHGAGYTAINWDVDPKDWMRPGAQVIAQRIIAQLHPGAIILMHDSAPDNQNQDRSQTLAALPAILAAIKARGLQPVTLPQMLTDAGLIQRPAPPTTPSPTTPSTQRSTPSPSDGAIGGVSLFVPRGDAFVWHHALVLHPQRKSAQRPNSGV